MIRPLLRLAFWLTVWLGGLAFAGQRNAACQTEGTIMPGCDRGMEYLGWGVALLGLVMSARALRDVPAVRRWIG